MTTTIAPAPIEITDDELKLLDSLSNSIDSVAEQDADLAAIAVANGSVVFKRGASEGPLVGLTPVFIDFETKMTAELSLRNMTLRQYLQQTTVESMSIAIGETDPVQVFFAENFPGDIPDSKRITAKLVATLKFLCESKEYVIVAHNAAFDSRCLTYLFGLDYPQNVWCTMEGAMGAWPELPGGFSLDNCSRKLGLPRHLRKHPLDLRWMAKARAAAIDGEPYASAKLEADTVEFVVQCRVILRAAKEKLPDKLTLNVLNRVLELYNQRDSEAAREVYYRQIARLSAREQGVALRTHRQRKHKMRIDPERLDSLMDKLSANAEYARREAGEYLSEEQVSNVFGVTNGTATSVRYARLRAVLAEIKTQEDDEFVSSSLKKINPILLARNPTVAALLEKTTDVGKMLSHKRRATVFRGVDMVDMELGYHRASTGRFSSPSVGKGLNCLAEGTPILTEHGWVPVEKVPATSRVWDGTEWVSHEGPLLRETRECINVAGVLLTPDHRVLTTDGWKEAAWLARQNTTTLQELVAVGALSSAMLRRRRATESTTGFSSDATAESSNPRVDVSSARPTNANAAPCGGASSATLFRCLPRFDMRGSVAGTTSKTGATIRPTASGIATADAASPCTRPGLTAPRSSSALSSRSISTSVSQPTLTGRSTASTTTGTTSRATFDWRPAQTTTVIARTWDLVNSGPRNRFQAGELIVHNCHNLPKHQKSIAEPVRKCFKLPTNLCFVRADLANVEYRIEGMLTKCKTVINMFDAERGGNTYNDPYCMTWKAMTGVLIDKKNPVRQVAKSATLGLGFCMAVAGYARVLLGVLASKAVTEEGLAKIVSENRWGPPSEVVIKHVRSKLGCSLLVITASFHIHRTFNQAHPEFSEAAAWIVDTVAAVASVPEGIIYRDHARKVIDKMYTSTRAPDRDLIGLEIDDDPLTARANVRVRCGPWPATVCWREPATRLTDFSGSSREKKLTVMKAMGFYKPFTKQLAIENVTQAAARNAMCMGVETLDHMGWPDIIHVHDEIMIVCKRERNTVLAARDALVTAFGPNHKMPYKWAILVKPDEITVTESMWEEESDIMVPNEKNKFTGNDRWGKLERNEPECLANLP